MSACGGPKCNLDCCCNVNASLLALDLPVSGGCAPAAVLTAVLVHLNIASLTQQLSTPASPLSLTNPPVSVLLLRASL
eukprot:1189221-Rhodomonas_salina.3